ncbi:hypothetical protein VN97_g12674, partial [Penicillium thymicola]
MKGLQGGKIRVPRAYTIRMTTAKQLQ